MPAGDGGLTTDPAARHTARVECWVVPDSPNLKEPLTCPLSQPSPLPQPERGSSRP